MTDLERSVLFAESVLGLRETKRDGRTSYLTCNSRHHELVLIEGDCVGCDHLAFESFDPDGLERLRQKLDRRGIPILDMPRERGIDESVWFAGPGGFVFEVFHGMAAKEPASYPTRGVRPVKFEHITVKSTCKEELEDLLQDILGLRVSDRADDQIVWLRVSEEHHGVSIIRADVDQLQHYAWQTDGWDAMRRIGDRLLVDGRRFLWGPGHHGIGDNYFSYFVDPEGAIVEYSVGIARIEDELTHIARTWPDEPESVNVWGNPPPPIAFIEGGVPPVNRDTFVKN